MAKVASGQVMRSAERMLQVLKCFGEGTPHLGIGEISERLALAPSTVRRLLLTLEAQGFVRQDESGGRYVLHGEVIRLAAAALSGSSLVKAATPILDALNEEIDETVQLTLRDAGALLIIDHRQSRHMIKTFHRIGHRYAPYRGSAAGKAVLAWLPDDTLLGCLPTSGKWDALTDRGIGDLAGLQAALEQTRKRGYGLNEGETEPDVWSVAAPVRDHRGEVVAAINVPCPVLRLSTDRQTMIIGATVAAGDALSAAVPFVT